MLGESLLLIACKYGFVSTVKLLLEYGADVNACNLNSAIPLYIATDNNNHSIAKLLIHYGSVKKGMPDHLHFY